jgi:uncharacterized protein (TIGR00106 family)
MALAQGIVQLLRAAIGTTRPCPKKTGAAKCLKELLMSPRLRKIRLEAMRRSTMLAEFSICPLGKVGLSKEIAKVVDVLESCHINYTLGPLSTCLEGTPDQVFTAIRRCHETLARDHDRVVTHIKLYERKDGPHSLAEMIDAVEKHLGRRATRGAADPEC